MHINRGWRQGHEAGGRGQVVTVGSGSRAPCCSQALMGLTGRWGRVPGAVSANRGDGGLRASEANGKAETWSPTSGGLFATHALPVHRGDYGSKAHRKRTESQNGSPTSKACSLAKEYPRRYRSIHALASITAETAGSKALQKRTESRDKSTVFKRQRRESGTKRIRQSVDKSGDEAYPTKCGDKV